MITNLTTNPTCSWREEIRDCAFSRSRFSLSFNDSTRSFSFRSFRNSSRYDSFCEKRKKIRRLLSTKPCFLIQNSGNLVCCTSFGVDWSKCEDLARVIVLCSWAQYATLTVSHSIQGYKWLVTNCWSSLAKCSFKRQKPELSPSELSHQGLQTDLTDHYCRNLLLEGSWKWSI